MDPFTAPSGVAAFLAALAILVLLAQPGRRLNQIFAALLLLRAASTASFGILRSADDASEALLYARLTVWYSLASPLLLLALAGEVFFPEARRSRFALLCVAGGATAALAAAHAFVPGALVAGVGGIPGGSWGLDSSPLLNAFTGFVALLEAAFVVLAARACLSPHERAISRSQAALLGLAFAFVPLRNGAFLLTLAGVDPARIADVSFLARAGPSLLAALAVAAAAPRLARAFEPPGRRLALSLLAFSALLGILDALALTSFALAAFLPSYETGASLTRAGFAGAASLALLRYGLAGMPESSRRHFETVARGGLALAAALLGAGVVLAFLGLTTAGLAAAPLLGIAVLLLSPAPLAPLAQRLARRVLLPPGDPLEEAARLDRARDADRADAPPALLGRYRVLRQLGRGSSATVHLALDLLKGSQVVVKRFHDASPRGGLAEARALGAVRHPRVVPLLDVERVGGETFLVLGHVPGGTARELVEREGPLPPARAASVALDVLDALEALHARSIVHGDVKPENVLLDAQGRGVLGDLGSARFFDVDATATGALAGASLSTVAPEVLRGEPPTPASDLYSVGAMTHRLLTGRHYVALEDADAFHARERILLDPPRLPDARVPAPLEEVLRRALAKRPEERHASAAEMARALRAASELLVHQEAASHSDHVAGA